MKAEGKRQQEERKLQAADMTTAAAAELEQLASLLKATLAVDNRIDWELLKGQSPFPENPPQQDHLPRMPEAPMQPRQPKVIDTKYQPKLGLLDKLIFNRKENLLAAARASFQEDLDDWRGSCTASRLLNFKVD